MRRVLLLGIAWLIGAGVPLLSVAHAAAPRIPEVLQLSGDIEGVHDPVLIRQTLQISTMIWEDGWPKVGKLP